MGAVYRGERDDGLFTQVVAIKLIRSTLLSASVLERFTAERQILANLRHTNIAALLDGGTDENANPYLVMEFLEGQPIDEYVRTRQLSVRQIIGLIRQVCAAVQHAHQNLVVHADIKPTNISVSADGHVKLLDFGIARLMGQETSPDEQPSGQLQPLTRAYASPERLAGVMPKPAADIYSIGVLLHQLITGELPRESTETVYMPGMPVSAAVWRSEADDDLGAIVCKAMHPVPEQRYASVTEITAELNRYLDRLPVQARGSDWRYLAGRFISRHRWAVTGASVFSLSLLVAVLVMTTLYLRAEAAREAASVRFTETRNMAKFMLFDLHDALIRIPGTTAAREALAEEGQRYLEILSGVPEAPLDVALETAVGYRKLAIVLGVPGEANLGRPEEAFAALDHASRQLEALQRAHPDDMRITLELARCQILQGRVRYIRDSTTGTSMALNDSGLELLQAVLDREPANPGALVWQWAARAYKADNLNYAGQAAEVLNTVRQLGVQAASIPEDPENPEFHIRIQAYLTRLLGDSLYNLDDRRAALDAYMQSERILQQALSEQGTSPNLSISLALSQWSIGYVLIELGQPAQAVTYTGLAEVTSQHLLDFGPNASAQRMLGSAQTTKAQALAALGRYAEAAGIFNLRYAQLMAIAERDSNDAGPARDLAVLMWPRAVNEWHAGRHAEGCGSMAAAIAQWHAVEGRWGLAALDATPLPEYRREYRRRCPGAPPPS